ncbi:MAG: hypothetical protein U1F27_10600 [Turneriella sp.]
MNGFTPKSYDTAVLWLYYRGEHAETGKYYHGLLPFFEVRSWQIERDF